MLNPELYPTNGKLLGMKKEIFSLILISFVFCFDCMGQEVIPAPEVDYRSDENPYYWKNNLPEPGYWQQDVHYEIKAAIDDSTDIIHGDSYRLTYWNNSPNTLTDLYFHLYQNAFQPGSHYHDVNINNEVVVKFGKYEQEGLGTTTEDIRVNGRSVKTELDNTILKVFLNEPLSPGDSLVVTMKFKTYFDTGTMRRRMKSFKEYGVNHYDGVHWYPAISVYDEKFGWGTEQHLDKEFYSNFGQWDVWLTFPQQYIVEATGYLMNEQEVLPEELQEKIKLENFKDKKYGSEPSIVVPYEKGKTKTWYFKAINVHNFAFTADPTYRREVLEWNGIKVMSLVREPHAASWQQSADYTLNVIQVYSQDFGFYRWPKIIVADAKDGMEYPMLTLDAGTYPGHQSLLAHEVGHMWFYGMVASNETYRAMMDEGFTQFLTIWAMDRLLGESRPRILKDKKGQDRKISKYLDPSVSREERLYYPYLNHVITGYDEQLNTHSSMFNGAIRHGGNYGLVYYKTGTMLYNLRYVLGEELFQDAMKYYFNKWKFAHPYPEDFRQAIIEYTQVDLNWFFDQWIETTKYIDYAIEDIDGVGEGEYEITFRRKGRMQMPIDFVVTMKDGLQKSYHIPNTWFVKGTDAMILPKWYGWDLLNPTYTARVSLQGELDYVEIDPDHYLADIDLRDNKKGSWGIKRLQFDHRLPNPPQWRNQNNYWRPDIWYNAFDGVKAGLHLEGDYLKHMAYSATAWYNTGLLQADVPEGVENNYQKVSFNYWTKHYLTKYWRGLLTRHAGYYNAGIWDFSLGLEKEFRYPDERATEYSNIFINTKFLVNDANTYRQYLLLPQHWGRPGEADTYVNSSINFGYFRSYDYTSGKGNYTIEVRTPSVLADYSYSRVNLTGINTLTKGKLDIRTRVFGQIGFGEFPFESALYLAGSNPEGFIDNKFTRARGIVDRDWVRFTGTPGYFQLGGGLNLRGYTGYLAPERLQEDAVDSLYYGYVGNSGASVSVEVDFDKYVKIKPKGALKNLKLDTYLFSDVGVLNTRLGEGRYSWGKIRTDAGIGTALTIKFSYLDINPLVLRFDMPFFLNTPPPFEDYFKFRYIFGVQRSF